MNLDDYQKQAYEFAVYPQEYKVTYPALGLCNEAGELCGKVKKWLRGDYEELPRQAIADELGDVLWYLAALCTDMNINLANCIAQNHDSGLIDVAIELSYDASIAAMQPREISHASNVLSDIRCIARIINIPLETIAQRNLDKLHDRERRGVIQGDGDDR